MRPHPIVAGFQSLILGLSALALCPCAEAQTAVSVAAKASTLGAGGELAVRLASLVAVRGGAQFFSFSRSSGIEGIDYDIRPRLRNGTILLDLHPFSGGFRITGGAVINRNRVDIVAVPSGPITVGNQTFQSGEVGRLDGRIRVRKISPYAGIGYVGQSRVAFSVDLGVAFHGTPQASLTGTSSLSGPERAIFDAEVAREREEIQQAINDESLARFHPVLAFGLVIRL